MSEAWTSALRDIHLSKLMRVIVTDVQKSAALDSHAAALPLGSNFSTAALQKSFDILGMYHDLYMSASCESYDDSGVNPDMSYVIGTMQFTMEDAIGKQIVKSIPIGIFSSSVLECVKESSAREVQSSSVRGLCWDRGLAVISINTEQVKKTLIHESIHALVGTIPELKDQMYGDTDSIKSEEIVTHFVTDHFDQLTTLNNLDFTVSKNIQKNKDKSISLCTSHVTSIKLHGKELISKTVSISANDEKVVNYKINKTREYGW